MPERDTEPLPGFFSHPDIASLVTDDLARFGRKADRFFRHDDANPPQVRLQRAITRQDWTEFGYQGFLGPAVPVELGGQGLGELASFFLSRALSHSLDVGLSLGLHVHNDVTMGWLLATRRQNLKDKYLPEMLAGRLIGCTCFTERGDPPMTTAERKAGKLIVNGRKAFAVNGVNADLCFVTAELDGKLCTLLVEKDSKGVSISKTWDKLGAACIDQADISFDNVAVVEENMISNPGLQQLLHWNHVMTTARAHVAFDAYLLMRILFGHILRYARNRVVGGRVLSQAPVFKSELARAYAELELIRSGLTEFVVGKANKPDDSPVEEAAGLKRFAVECAHRFGLTCCDMEGGRGYMNDSVSLHLVKQIMALRYSTGSQYKTREIAAVYQRQRHRTSSRPQYGHV